MSDIDPLAQVDVEREIMRLSRRLSALTVDITSSAVAAAKADHEYKMAYAKAVLTAEGKTVGSREAQATLDCDGEFYDKVVYEATYKAQQEAGRNLRAQLDALRTIAADIRDQVAHPQGRGG